MYPWCNYAYFTLLYECACLCVRVFKFLPRVFIVNKTTNIKIHNRKHKITSPQLLYIVLAHTLYVPHSLSLSLSSIHTFCSFVCLCSLIEDVLFIRTYYLHMCGCVCLFVLHKVHINFVFTCLYLINLKACVCVCVYIYVVAFVFVFVTLHLYKI